MITLVVVLAFLAAGCNALSSVMQRKAAEPDEDQPFGVKLLLRLVRRRSWQLAAALTTTSALLQAVALSFGALSLVEPILAVELPLTLILGSVILRYALRTPDWMTTAAMAAGLALMIAVLAPTGGKPSSVDTGLRIVAAVATAGAVALIVVAATMVPRRWRAALLGVAGGAGFGLGASLLKLAMGALTEHGVAGLLSAWETYGTIVAGLGSVVLVQAALHAGTLVAAQPGITLLDPLVAVLWGVVVLGERTRTGWILILALVGALIIVVAAVILSRALESAGAEAAGAATGGAAGGAADSGPAGGAAGAGGGAAGSGPADATAKEGSST